MDLLAREGANIHSTSHELLRVVTHDSYYNPNNLTFRQNYNQNEPQMIIIDDNEQKQKDNPQEYKKDKENKEDENLKQVKDTYHKKFKELQTKSKKKTRSRMKKQQLEQQQKQETHTKKNMLASNHTTFYVFINTSPLPHSPTHTQTHVTATEQAAGVEEVAEALLGCLERVERGIAEARVVLDHPRRPFSVVVEQAGDN